MEVDGRGGVKGRISSSNGRLVHQHAEAILEGVCSVVDRSIRADVERIVLMGVVHSLFLKEYVDWRDWTRVQPEIPY